MRKGCSEAKAVVRPLVPKPHKIDACLGIKIDQIAIRRAYCNTCKCADAFLGILARQTPEHLVDPAIHGIISPVSLCDAVARWGGKRLTINIKKLIVELAEVIQSS